MKRYVLSFGQIVLNHIWIGLNFGMNFQMDDGEMWCDVMNVWVVCAAVYENSVHGMYVILGFPCHAFHRGDSSSPAFGDLSDYHLFTFKTGSVSTMLLSCVVVIVYALLWLCVCIQCWWCVHDMKCEWWWYDMDMMSLISCIRHMILFRLLLCCFSSPIERRSSSYMAFFINYSQWYF